MRAVRLWDQNYSLLIFSWGAPLTSAPTLMEGRCKPKLIEINDLLIWRLWAQNTNYIQLQKSEVYCSVEFWVCGCTCPMSANQTSPALSSTMILLPNDSFFLSNTESLQLEATTKGNFHFYIFGGFFLYVTIPQVSEGATSVFHHPALMLDYFAVSPLCFAENPEPPGKPRGKGHSPSGGTQMWPLQKLRKGLIEEEVPKELRWERICLQCRRPNFRKTLWRKEWISTPVFLSGEFHGQRRLVGYSPWGPIESDTTEKLTHTNI